MLEHQAFIQHVVEDLLKEAKRLGADSAEAAASQDSGLSVNVRMGELETLEYTRDNNLGITVYFGKRKGSANTSDLSAQAIRETVRAACDIARYTADDTCSGLADADLMAINPPDLDLYHPWQIEPTEATALARRCEDAARAHDARIINSEGASLNTLRGIHVYGNSHGFIGGYPSSRHSLSCAVIGRDESGMQRDYWYSTERDAERLAQAEEIGIKCAQRTLARLGARRLSTGTAPVIFCADVAPSLLRSFVAAIRGGALYRRASFLLDKLGQPIFPSFVRIHENPLIPCGLSSAPFDNEGVATSAKDLVKDGILQSYVLDSYSARKLGTQTTANAGGVHNLSIQTSGLNLADLMREMDRGLVVTEMMGQGVNRVTGDFSRGATGFWVEGGEIAYPVEEITIAGNLRDIFLGLVAVGNDTDIPGSVRTGSWFIESMTIAGD
ncbi:MAG: metalloprotease PmbA [Gammaproteobacteria bacterium]|nr:metalloprotease PmbA [Gammaproteobacteria bacterium]MBU1653941.1 metalloprotease PmbA [Gammaproteobacteria bacterium]MBU1962641.1 metalloprotease PmbA [Gammaproteobacteria bacterium]